MAYGGGDNLDLIRRFGERVGYVHIKQMDPEILAQVAAEDLSFGEAVKRGVCVTPPAGVPSPAEVVAELSKLDAELFVIVEQDLYPCAPEVPLPIAVRTREHLALQRPHRNPAPHARTVGHTHVCQRRHSAYHGAQVRFSCPLSD